MAKKQFKAESKRLLDLMVGSIYTHKEIFLRELISNASDAIDKLYYKALTEKISGVSKNDFFIKITPDEGARQLVIEDNGIGMGKEALESNLGTIARSGSLLFKDEEATGKAASKIDIIGQFGVGFYSAFMVSKEVKVVSRAWGEDQAWEWASEGADGYSIKEGRKDGPGTVITLTLKDDTDEEKYGEYLSGWKLRTLVKRYSDYIRYPILLETPQAEAAEPAPAGEGESAEPQAPKGPEVLNSMVPLWKRPKAKITDEEYADFYKDKFSDFEDPLKVIHTGVEGVISYEALLFVPARAPYNYYTKDFEKGLQLYSSGVLIMDKAKDLLPDYFSFVKGVVDSQDLSLNISRELLQHDRQLRAIEQRLEKKIKSELEAMLSGDREKYEKFFAAFGLQLKFGLYDNFGAAKDVLKDLVLYYSSAEKKLVTFGEYVARMKEDQQYIYYATGESVEQIDRMPQTELLKDRGYEILYGPDQVDEFALKMMREYEGKEFRSVSEGDLGIEESEEEKQKAEKEQKKYADLLAAVREALDGKVTDVRLSKRLKSHPVVLVSGEGGLSLEMEKVLKQMPGAEAERIKAERILEINAGHKVLKALAKVYEKGKAEGATKADREAIKAYAGILYDQALLMEGLPVEDPVAFSNAVCALIEKTV
ncbi:MAG: molecular chaperone HtpG [Clostridiales Family XIII bacterium]|nr:molecular chaperone HtpG [Clostridiales Family XIII bacterium]